MLRFWMWRRLAFTWTDCILFSGGTWGNLLFWEYFRHTFEDLSLTKCGQLIDNAALSSSFPLFFNPTFHPPPTFPLRMITHPGQFEHQIFLHHSNLILITSTHNLHFHFLPADTSVWLSVTYQNLEMEHPEKRYCVMKAHTETETHNIIAKYLWLLVKI